MASASNFQVLIRSGRRNSPSSAFWLAQLVGYWYCSPAEFLRRAESSRQQVPHRTHSYLVRSFYITYVPATWSRDVHTMTHYFNTRKPGTMQLKLVLLMNAVLAQTTVFISCCAVARAQHLGQNGRFAQQQPILGAQKKSPQAFFFCCAFFFRWRRFFLQSTFFLNRRRRKKD